MDGFTKKLIGRLEEHKTKAYVAGITSDPYQFGACNAMDSAIKIVNQLAEEYKPCNKPSCKDCEVYDKEKHYCPKWCDVIKHTAEELAEEYNNDFCKWEADDKEIDVYYTKCGQSHIFIDGNPKENNHVFCPYCGKKIKVVK